MAMPEESHFFSQLLVALHHLLQPQDVQTSNSLSLLLLYIFSFILVQLFFLQTFFTYACHETFEVIIGSIEKFGFFGRSFLKCFKQVRGSNRFQLTQLVCSRAKTRTPHQVLVLKLIGSHS